MGGSVGGYGGSIGTSGNAQSTAIPTDDPRVTHTRGRIDDVIQHLGVIRGRASLDNWTMVAKSLDRIDAITEAVINEVVKE